MTTAATHLTDPRGSTAPPAPQLTAKAISPSSQYSVASAWRVLPDAYVFPREDEYRASAARNGWELTRSVEPEDGGYRHELVVSKETGRRSG